MTDGFGGVHCCPFCAVAVFCDDAHGLCFILFLDHKHPLSVCGLFLLPLCVKTISIQEHRQENAAYTRTMGFVQFRCRQE